MVVIVDVDMVILSSRELTMARDQAEALHGRLRRRGIKDGHGAKQGEITPEMEAGGAAAELAVAGYLQTDWTAASGDAYSADVGKNVQVRSSNKPRPSHCLIIRRRDLDKYGEDAMFVLVIQSGNTFDLKGWLRAGDARKVGRFHSGGLNRPPAWFVPENQLRDMKELGV
jgi:hypothetical protein